MGVWKIVFEKFGLLFNVFGELCDCGVLLIRFCIGNIGCVDVIFK